MMRPEELAALREEDASEIEDLRARITAASREELESALLDAVAAFAAYAVPAEGRTTPDPVIAAMTNGILQNARLPGALNRRRRLLGLWP